METNPFLRKLLVEGDKDPLSLQTKQERMRVAVVLVIIGISSHRCLQNLFPLTFLYV